MKSLVIDIETIGEDFETLDEKTKDVLTRWIKKESYSEDEYNIALNDLKSGLGFSPLTGKIVAIGMLDYQSRNGKVLFSAPDSDLDDFSDNGIQYIKADESEMLKIFWETVMDYQGVITFNGRAFDIPFITIRSAVNEIAVSKNFLGSRYQSYQRDGDRHIDLADELSFYGAVRKKGNLHLYCKAFGIESPKAEGITGDDVKYLFENKKFEEIARYNARDLKATAQLFDVWDKYINIK